MGLCMAAIFRYLCISYINLGYIWLLYFVICVYRTLMGLCVAGPLNGLYMSTIKWALYQGNIKDSHSGDCKVRFSWVKGGQTTI